MAQEGDTITYVYDGNTDGENYLIPQTEDISNVGGATVEYCDGAGANGTGAASGGRVENADIDLSGQDTLYIWVAGDGNSRYNGDTNAFRQEAGGSTEIAFVNTDARDSSDEPFLVGAGGGGNGYVTARSSGSGGGARGGVSANRPDPDGVAPPAGGDGGTSSDTAGEAGDGAIDDQNRGLVSGGTTIKGGGGGADTNGEIKITYKSGAPSAPSNVAVTDAQTEGELTVDWDAVSDATGYYVYRAQASGSAKADYTQVADVSSPPYVDQNLEDGERYYYRVSAYN